MGVNQETIDRVIDISEGMDIEDAANFLSEAIDYARGRRPPADSPVWCWDAALRQEPWDQTGRNTRMTCIASRTALNAMMGARVTRTLLFTSVLAELLKNAFEAAYDVGGKFASHVLWRYNGTNPEDLLPPPSEAGQVSFMCALAVMGERGYLMGPAIRTLEIAVANVREGENWIDELFVRFWREFLSGGDDATKKERIVCKALRRLQWSLRVAKDMAMPIDKVSRNKIAQLTEGCIALLNEEAVIKEADWRWTGQTEGYRPDAGECHERPIQALLGLP